MMQRLLPRSSRIIRHRHNVHPWLSSSGRSLCSDREGGEKEGGGVEDKGTDKQKAAVLKKEMSALSRYDPFEIEPTKAGLSVANPRSYELMRGCKILPTVEEPKSVSKILKDEMTLSELGRKDLEIPRQTDILIIGGGLVGCSLAYFLRNEVKDGTTVTVVERDHQYTYASSGLSVGGIRQQFSSPENVQMSVFGAQFLRELSSTLAIDGEDHPDPQFHHGGYLTLGDEGNAEELHRQRNMQIEHGAINEMMSQKKLQERFPWLNVDDLECGVLGLENEGWFDPWSVLGALRKKSMLLGANFVHGEVVGFERNAEKLSRAPGQDIEYSLQQCLVRSPRDNNVYPVRFSIAVNCAGPWAGEVASLAGVGEGRSLMGIPLPVAPRKRYVYNAHCPSGPGLDCPLVIDPTGTYFRREGLGGCYLFGRSPSEDKEPPIDHFEVDHSFFDEDIWPVVAHRVSAFNELKVKSSWAGFYDFNYGDQNLVIGHHPYLRNLIFANGSSGHGVQHAFAVGRAVMELIYHNDFKTIDLSRFGFDRFLAHQEYTEKNIW